MKKTYRVKNYKGNIVESLKRFSELHKGMKIVKACEDGKDLKIKIEEAKKIEEAELTTLDDLEKRAPAAYVFYTEYLPDHGYEVVGKPDDTILKDPKKVGWAIKAKGRTDMSGFQILQMLCKGIDDLKDSEERKFWNLNMGLFPREKDLVVFFDYE